MYIYIYIYINIYIKGIREKNKSKSLLEIFRLLPLSIHFYQQAIFLS